ncbi:acetyltransferase [Haloflavibacter putidus]|uniref:Acetyltransferase n=1 Tax=Haloflavibacter putidus TaxID=2576776 RepID=A0A507ZBW9_9FLAO|nr:acetyltransferase [Haloflavibacter putidus]TQD33488.1 acetyltransferase [Haloflavibacter putidus]
MRNKNINLYGASGHAKVVIDSIMSSDDFYIGKIYDDNRHIDKLSGFSVRHSSEIDDKSDFIISIGNNQTRKKIVNQYDFTFTEAIVHFKAIVSPFAILGNGSVVMPLAVINAASKIGEHVIINTGSIIEHDCVLQDFCHISPNATLAGGVIIGEETHIGTGAIVLPGLRIGKNCTIGAGAVVTKNIPDNCTAVGIPAKPIKFG